MGNRMAAWAALVASVAIVFGLGVAVGLRLTPPPRSETDYLVIGSVATLLGLGVLFAVLVVTWLRAPGIFFKRRAKRPPEDNVQ